MIRPPPAKSLAQLRGLVHKTLLDAARGRLPPTALKQFADDYETAWNSAEGLHLETYYGRIRDDGTVAVSRGSELVAGVASSPRLVAFTLLRDVFRRAGAEDPEETASRAIFECLRQYPYLAARDWIITEQSIRNWASGVQPG